MERISVIGAGAWGTSLASLLAEKGLDVSLWAFEEDVVRGIRGERENRVFLPGITLPRGLKATNSIEEALKGAGIVVCAVPSHFIRGVFGKAKALFSDGPVIVSAAKGIEEETLLTPSGILEDTLKGSIHGPLAVLSGPSFAKEVSLKLPAAVVAASKDEKAASIVQKTFSTPYFRVYTSADVIGVELGGALKNIIAIASGISDGLKLGNNARAALITRGLAEITRLGARLGANALTFSGLSGLGDLVLTCTGPLSRNYTVGVQLGEGKGIKEITGKMKMVAEGVKTSRAAVMLSRKNGVEMPITEAVHNIIYDGKPPKEAVYELMTRDLKGEL